MLSCSSGPVAVVLDDALLHQPTLISDSCRVHEGTKTLHLLQTVT